jgi:hypothetical protein
VNIVPFEFDGAAVRTCADEDGTPLFCARDVAAALGYQEPGCSVNRHCAGPAIYRHVQTDAGFKAMRFIAEPDVNRLIASSKRRDTPPERHKPLVSTIEVAQKSGIKVSRLYQLFGKDKNRPTPVFRKSKGGGPAYYEKSKIEEWLSSTLGRQIVL